MPTAPRARRGPAPARPVAGLVAGLLAGLLLVSGCGSQPPLSPPTGVDGLVIPTPSPDPSDFVTRIDNRWLPLAEGSRWTYAVTNPGVATSLVSTVLSTPLTVAGVSTTVVRDVVRTRRGATVSTLDRYYAQDRAGNVWWFGRSGPDAWRAGVDGAEAGLVMPAAPRLGDGYLTGSTTGQPRLVDTVITLHASASTPYGEVSGALRLERTSVGSADATELTYEPGVGLVQSVDVEGSRETTSLTAYTR